MSIKWIDGRLELMSSANMVVMSCRNSIFSFPIHHFNIIRGTFSISSNTLRWKRRLEILEKVKRYITIACRTKYPPRFVKCCHLCQLIFYNLVFMSFINCCTNRPNLNRYHEESHNVASYNIFLKINELLLSFVNCTLFLKK